MRLVLPPTAPVILLTAPLCLRIVLNWFLPTSLMRIPRDFPLAYLLRIVMFLVYQLTLLPLYDLLTTPLLTLLLGALLGALLIPLYLLFL